MTRPSASLMAEVYPDVPLARPLDGRETLLSIEKAGRLLGYRPEIAWQDAQAATCLTGPLAQDDERVDVDARMPVGPERPDLHGVLAAARPARREDDGPSQARRASE